MFACMRMYVCLMCLRVSKCIHGCINTCEYVAVWSQMYTYGLYKQTDEQSRTLDDSR